MPVDDTLDALERAGGNLRGSEFRKLLEGLGFAVKKMAKGEHYTVKHSGLSGFFGTNYACQHGADGIVKKGYVSKMRSVIRTHKEELQRLYG